MNDDVVHLVYRTVGGALSGGDRFVLAVSGGIDSMTLLDAACAVIETSRITVATFDHGTGQAATAAVDHVEREAAARGVACVASRATTRLHNEAAFREARWAFLRAVASDRDAIVCTGHTEDDQIETVLMRLMRGSGVRGLASLYATSDIARPLLPLRRRMVRSYAERRALAWVEDPSNPDRRFRRNRLRHDLLPALRSVDPSFDDTLIGVARQASDWRREVERLCDELAGVVFIDEGRGVRVPAGAFGAAAEQSARLLWPELASRAGAVLDRRGLDRLARFTVDSRTGARVQLSGGWEVVRGRNSFALRHVSAAKATVEPSALSDGTRFGDWTFRAAASVVPTSTSRDAWAAWLPTHAPLLVRPWRAGDAMAVGQRGSRRKVKHLLSAAGVTGHERAGWPVVVSGADIVWIPGVRRTDATAARSGGPGLAFVCEYDHR